MTSLNQVTDAFEERLRAVLPEAAFRPATDHYLTELRGQMRGQGGLVVAPGTTDETAEVLRLANEERVAVVPFSGGTGLVGGQVAPNLSRPLILSLERMDKIRAVYPQENAMIVEAGAILQNVRDAADQHDRLFPLLLASEGSARIGGNLATNAGGMNVLRYGNTRDLCLGIEAVLADGTVVSGLKRLRKDNTGYDLKNLLIGSEGTLGVITAATLRLFQKPENNATALLVVPNPAAALELLDLARDYAGDLISIFELISGEGFRFISETIPDHRLPVSEIADWMILGEIGAPRGVNADAIWQSVVEAGMERGLILDGVQAGSEAQRQALIDTRELIPEANRRIGAVASQDISLPLSVIPDFIPRCREALNRFGDLRLNCFGHLGDGNLHYNVYPSKGRNKADYANIRADLIKVIHDLVGEYGGSFSAEHGIGRFKVDDLQRYGDPGRLAAMRMVKRALDPNGIMNPGAVLT